jgi:hypothetical protein
VVLILSGVHCIIVGILISALSTLRRGDGSCVLISLLIKARMLSTKPVPKESFGLIEEMVAGRLMSICFNADD